MHWKDQLQKIKEARTQNTALLSLQYDRVTEYLE